MNPLVMFVFVKDGFKHGEYSIYKRVVVDGETRVETYLFGLSNKHDALTVCSYLAIRQVRGES